MWYEYEITVQGDDYTVFLTNVETGAAADNSSIIRMPSAAARRGSSAGSPMRATWSLAAYPNPTVVVPREASSARRQTYAGTAARSTTAAIGARVWVARGRSSLGRWAGLNDLASLQASRPELVRECLHHVRTLADEEICEAVA